MKKNKLRLRKITLAVAVIFPTFLLFIIPVGVCQTNTPVSLVINELMANNDAAVPGPDGDYPDWVELYNGGAETVNLGGMYLTGNLANPNAWQFPSGTIIESNSFLVVWADNSPEIGGLHTSFSLNASGEAVGLFAADGETRIDSITFGPQDDDVSFGRLPDGGLSWNHLIPTPGSPNQLYEPAEIPDYLFINEFMANNDGAVAGPNGTYPDWIELYNADNETMDLGGMYLTDDLTKPEWQFPAGTTIESNGFLVVWADNASDLSSLHASFGLNAGGESIGLFASDSESIIDSITFDRQVSDVSYGRLPDGSENWNYLTPTPGSANDLGEVVNVGVPSQFDIIPEGLFINELMADNQITIAGPDATYPDWIELYNADNETIDLGGMYLTDDLTKPEWQFPAGTTIESNGFLVVWADNASDLSSLHASFGLNAGGESIGLFASDSESIIDSITFDRQVSDVSYGRLPDGSENWNYLTPTPGSANDLGEVVNVGVPSQFDIIPEGLFINELMADNQITIAGPDATYPDWIELYNADNETIDLGGMYLTDTLANPTKWRFPNNTVIEGGGYLVIWADNSSDKSSLHSGFNLRANGEEVGLFASDGVTLIDSVVFPKQLGDVSYGRLPDGSENWMPLLRATPGWANNKPQATFEFSIWTVLILIGAIAALSALVIVAGKIHARRKK